MSRAQALLIEQQDSVIAGLRELASGLKGELTGERRGESRVTAQLARDIEQSAVREHACRQARDRAVGDVRRLLRTLAGYVLDERAAGSDAIEQLVDAVTLAGFSLNGPIAMVAAERADAAARHGAHMSAAALASAPVSTRTA
jgi:hypothetical protein